MRRALRRTTTCLAFAVLLPVLAGGLPGAQAADPVGDPVGEAAAQVTALQREVDRAAAELTEGTRRLEAEQAALTRVRGELEQAQRAAQEASGRSTQARDRLRLVVTAAYKSPVPDSFVLALSGPEQFRAALSAQSDLQRVRGRQSDLLREATAERVRAQSAVRTVEQLGEDADDRAQQVRAGVRRLQATARATERRLDAAATRLAAAEAVQRTARARAADRASAMPAAGPAPTCSGRSPGGVANGFLGAASLCPLDGEPGMALRADAAAAFNRMTAAYRAARGAALCVNDSYRSYRQQVSVYARKPQLAAVPGTSRHGLGVAVDLGCGVERFGSSAYRWMKANGPRFGWVHPAWAEPGGSMPEPWHWEYDG